MRQELWGLGRGQGEDSGAGGGGREHGVLRSLGKPACGEEAPQASNPRVWKVTRKGLGVLRWGGGGGGRHDQICIIPARGQAHRDGFQSKECTYFT